MHQHKVTVSYTPCVISRLKPLHLLFRKKKRHGRNWFMFGMAEKSLYLEHARVYDPHETLSGPVWRPSLWTWSGRAVMLSRWRKSHVKIPRLIAVTDFGRTLLMNEQSWFDFGNIKMNRNEISQQCHFQQKIIMQLFELFLFQLSLNLFVYVHSPLIWAPPRLRTWFPCLASAGHFDARWKEPHAVATREKRNWYVTVDF